MRAHVVTLLAVAALTVGCASGPDETASDEPSSSAPAAPDVADEDATSEPAPTGARVTEEAGDVEIDISMFSFDGDVVEITVGQTVTWTNQDATRHTVTSGVDGEPNGTFEVAFADRGDTASVTFDEPGEYRYFCSPHNFMVGTVIVTE
ncbi:MAG: plastocyanin/azurin family copper-binding protein [Nitriliruptor sp.]|uniref:cupredoxin domain-containing protein n=1 Tax=Nitriliruptor sp. TaxID=2448056 RepID=UPI0034A05FCA